MASAAYEKIKAEMADEKRRSEDRMKTIRLEMRVEALETMLTELVSTAFPTNDQLERAQQLLDVEAR